MSADFVEMSWRITITFPKMVGDEGNDLLHRVRNLGEALYGHFGVSGGGFVDLQKADSATTTLVVERVGKRDVSRTLQVVRQLASKHFPERTPEITKEKAAA
ncbi:hypothetical protein [Terricaulis silvestris]|nr:hypothetical protein [Terricaulis silvestris]